MYVWCISFVLVLCAVVTAAPALALRCAGISRRLVWFSWLWNFVVPFTVLLIFPLRETIDWTGIQEDLCVVAVSRALASPGIDMSSALGSLQQQGLAGLATLQSAVQQQASQELTGFQKYRCIWGMSTPISGNSVPCARLWAMQWTHLKYPKVQDLLMIEEFSRLCATRERSRLSGSASDFAFRFGGWS